MTLLTYDIDSRVLYVVHAFYQSYVVTFSPLLSISLIFTITAALISEHCIAMPIFRAPLNTRLRFWSVLNGMCYLSSLVPQPTAFLCEIGSYGSTQVLCFCISCACVATNLKEATTKC